MVDYFDDFNRYCERQVSILRYEKEIGGGSCPDA